MPGPASCVHSPMAPGRLITRSNRPLKDTHGRVMINSPGASSAGKTRTSEFGGYRIRRAQNHRSQSRKIRIRAIASQKMSSPSLNQRPVRFSRYRAYHTTAAPANGTRWTAGVTGGARRRPTRRNADGDEEAPGAPPHRVRAGRPPASRARSATPLHCARKAACRARPAP